MRRNRVLIFTRVLILLFIIGTIIALFIALRNIDNRISIDFLFGYLFFAIFLIIYVLIITILNSRKLKWIEIRTMVFKFIALFILLGTINFIFDYVFRPTKIDLVREFSISIGLAFGITFLDVTIFKKE